MHTFRKSVIKVMKLLILLTFVFAASNGVSILPHLFHKHLKFVPIPFPIVKPHFELITPPVHLFKKVFVNVEPVVHVEVPHEEIIESTAVDVSSDHTASVHIEHEEHSSVSEQSGDQLSSQHSEYGLPSMEEHKQDFHVNDEQSVPHLDYGIPHEETVLFKAPIPVYQPTSLEKQLVHSSALEVKINKESTYAVPAEKSVQFHAEVEHKRPVTDSEVVHSTVLETDKQLIFKTNSKNQDYEFTVSKPTNVKDNEGTSDISYGLPIVHDYDVRASFHQDDTPSNYNQHSDVTPVQFKQPFPQTGYLNTQIPIQIQHALPHISHVPQNFPDLPENIPHVHTNFVQPVPLTQHSPKFVEIPTNTQLSIVDDKNQYSHGFSLDDGTKVSEQGHLISTNDGWEYVLAKNGQYEYVSPDGTPVKVEWIADHKGFRAEIK